MKCFGHYVTLAHHMCNLALLFSSFDRGFCWLIQFPLWTYRELGNLEEPTFSWVAGIEVQEEHQAGAFVNEQACEVCSHLSATENAQVGLYRVCVYEVLLNFRHLVASEKINIRSSGIT